MKVVCNGEVFSKNLGVISRGVSARTTIQILGGILLETREASIKLSATDMELSIQTRLPANVESEGRVVVPARIFNDVVRALPPGEVVLEHDSTEGLVRLTTGGNGSKNEYKIRAYAAEDFPRLPEFQPEDAFILSGDTLVQTIEKVSRSYSRDETRPVLTGVLVVLDGLHMQMVTTDSYRLSVKNTLLDIPYDGSRRAIIPARALQEVSRIYGTSEEENIEVILSENQALFRVGEVLLGTRLIEGNFPEYERLLPETFIRQISVSREELMDTLRRVNLFAQRQTPPVPVKMHFSKGSLEVGVRSQEIGEGREQLDASSEEDFEVSFNPGYLMDGVSAVDSDKVVFKFNDPLKPGLIVPGTDEGEPDFRYLIMPMRSQT